MSAVINTNIAAIRTHNVYNRNNDYMNQALTRVSTGMKVNSAKDNASTFAISEKMRDRIRANDQANQNVQNDQALLKTAEGGIGNTIDILKNLKERAVNAANDSNINTDRGAIQTEINELMAQIEENATKVKFNGRTLLDGSLGTDNTTASATQASYNVLATTTAYTYTAAGVTLPSTSDVVVNSTNITGDNASSFISAVTTAVGTDTTGKSVATDLGTEYYISDGNGSYTTATGTVYYDSTNSNIKIKEQDTTNTNLYTRSANGTSTTTSTPTDVGVASGSATTNQTGLNFYVGGESGFNVSVNIEAMTLENLGLTDSNGTSLLDVTTSANAQTAIDTINNALEKALSAQTKVGAMETRLGYTSDNLVTMNENLEAADSVMRDSDIAKEMTQYMKYSVLAQASQYMLAQSSQNAFSVLNLLQA